MFENSLKYLPLRLLAKQNSQIFKRIPRDFQKNPPRMRNFNKENIYLDTNPHHLPGTNSKLFSKRRLLSLVGGGDQFLVIIVNFLKRRL